MTLFPKEDHLPLALDNEILAQQLSCSTETPSKSGRRLPFVGSELAGMASFELVDEVHVLTHGYAALLLQNSSQDSRQWLSGSGVERLLLTN